MSERLLSIRAAAARIGMPYSMLYKVIRGDPCPFPVFQPSPSVYYIDPKDIDRWKAACTRGGEPKNYRGLGER
jgi:predicted DNA-binding transcriptional regulator AlpA